MASQFSSTNSSPKELTSSDLRLLCNVLNPVASKCLALGIQLGMEKASIDIIMTDYKNDCRAQLCEIISERLKHVTPLTWHNIVTALKSPSVNHPDLARHIESWYKPPSLDFQQHPASEPQQHLSFGGERPHPMVMMGQTRVSSRGNPNIGMASVPTSSTPFWTKGPSGGEYDQSPSQMSGTLGRVSQTPARGPPHGEIYQPPTQMIGQTLVRGPLQGENYQPPTQMIGQTLVRGPPHGENYHPPTQGIAQTLVRGPDHGENSQSPLQMMGQTPVKGPPHGENYQSPPQMMGQTPVRGSLHEENFQPSTRMMDQTPVRGWPPYPYLVAWDPPHRHPWGTPYTYFLHQMPTYQTAYPNTLYPMLAPTPTTGFNTEFGVPPSKMPSINPELAHMHSSNGSHSQMSAHRRSPMDTFVHYIKVTYKQCEIEKDLNVLKWPPTPSKIFINLACIDWESVLNEEKADEYTMAMVKDGNVDVIMKEKRNIDFDDIVRDLPPLTALEKVVLVEGAPGVGKSTFAWEFCRRWERGEIAQQYQLVLLLRLRDERMSKAKSLQDLIYYPDKEENISGAIKGELVNGHGVNTLIILEGFDELPDCQRKESSIFLELILGKLLLHATIMITSRPWATGALLAQFKHRIFLHVEILGFTEENITRYVTSVFTGEGKKTAIANNQSVTTPDKVSEEAKKIIDDVMAYIGKYPQIKACMYIPLNAAIVVSIYRESMKRKWNLPTTLTEVYQALTRILLLRHLRGHAEYQICKVESFEDLPKEVYRQLLVISKIAYDGVCREGGKSVQLIFPDIPDTFETLGLMQSVSQLFMDGQKTSHNFLHLTFQEFLSAFLISTMSPEEQLKHFQRHKDGRLRVVLRFLAGITKLNRVTPDQLRSLLGEPAVEQSDEHQTSYCNQMRPDVCVSAHHTNWLFEAQNSELLQSLFYNHTVSFTFTRGMLPLEYFSVGYCSVHSHRKWLLIFEEGTEEEKLHMFLSGAKTGDSSDYRVALKTRSMTTKDMRILVNGFSSNVQELYYLKIPDNGNSLSLPPSSTLHILELQIDDNKSAFNISCDLLFSSLKALIISSGRKGTTLGAKTCKAIGKFLSSTTSLKEFHLSLNIRSHGYIPHVSDKDMEVITNALSDNIALPLKSLGIDCKCTFTTTTTRSLVHFITKSASLQHLKIHIDTFKDVGIFAECLSNNTALPLEILNIDCNCTFNTTATRSLVQFITSSTTLQYIKICHVTFSAQGLIELTKAIHHCSRLQEKKLEKLTFHLERSEDVVNMRGMIKDHPDMQRSITDWDGVTNVHSSLMQVDEKRRASTVSLGLGLSQDMSLSLVGMGISDIGAVAVAQALHHNYTLEMLYLSNNSSSDAGAVALAQVLHRNCILKQLHLSNNSISDAGAEDLAQALHHNSTLERLDLSGNDAIGQGGTHQLVQALTVNPSITRYGLILPRKCEECAIQCKEYKTVRDRITFW